LQTKEWLQFQKSIGREVWRFYDGKIKANIVKHDLPLGKNYLYIPHGPEIDFNAISGTINNEISQFIGYVKNLAKDQKSVFIKIEPVDDKVPEVMHRFGFKKSSKEIQPRKTVVIDIQKSQEELLAGMHHKTRYNIKVSEKHRVAVKDSDDIDAFWKLLSKTAKRDRFISHPKKYYQKLFEYFNGNSEQSLIPREMKIDLIMAHYNDKAVSGALVMVYKDTCYYLHGASDYDFRSVMAPYALHWENIKHLKEQGIKYYDLWGIDSFRWPGVTRFKLGWLGLSGHGEESLGRQIEYPGSFDLSISRFWYLAYRIMRKMF